MSDPAVTEKIRKTFEPLTDANLQLRIDQAGDRAPHREALLAEKGRREKLASEKAEEAANRRHGEEMTAAAFSNLLARKAIRRADVGVALAVLAIVVSIIAIVVSIWLATAQHSQR